MSRKIVIGAAVLLVPAYVATSWGLGRATHARFDGFEQEWNKQAVAILKIAERDYTPGIFSSEERITFELNDEVFGKILASEDAQSEKVLFEGDEGSVEADEGSLAQANQAPRITVLHKIQHGPLPGFRSFALARIESTLVLSEETREEIAKALGDRQPLLVTTVLGISGAGASTVTSPAFDVDEDGRKLSWKGFHGELSYGRGLSSFECDLNAPGMELTERNGISMQMGEISFDCNLDRAFDDIYLGNAALNIASMQYSKIGEKPMKIERVTYAGDIRKSGDYVDMAIDVGVGNIELDDFAMSDLRYDIAINHLHGPTYAAMQRKLQNVSAASAAGDPTASLAVMGTLGEFLPQLLEHAPQLVIERIGFSMPEGEAGLTAMLQLNNFTKDDMASGTSMALLGKLDASADIWFAEGLLARAWAQRTSHELGEEASATDKLALLRTRVAQLEQQGYIQRTENRLESHLEFKNGALTANGKPIGPMMGGM